MKFKKLDARGFSHHFVMVLVVLIVAIGGVYYLVASHADSCPAIPASGPSTGAVCQATNELRPTGVAVDSNGNVYIANSSSNVVEEVTPSDTLSIVAGNGTTGLPSPGPATSSELSGPFSVAVDGSGNRYIADRLNNVVEKVTPGGTLSIVAGNGKHGTPTPGSATNSELGGPTGVAVDSSGNVYIADSGNSMIEKVTPSGLLSIVAGNGTMGLPSPGPAISSALSGPHGVAVDSNGNVYIADSGNSMIEKVTPSGQLSIVASNVAPSTSGAPVAPANLRATSLSSAEIGLSWIPSTGAASYNVYRNGIKVANVGPTAPDSSTAFADTGLVSNTTYSYYVTTLNAVGQQSSPSNTVAATTKAVVVSPPPVTTTAEELSIPPQRRPAQYLSLCEVGKTAYVSDNTSNCWAGGSLLENYAPSVPGTYYNIPCVGAAANSAADRFVYIAPGAVCPSATTPVPLQLSSGEQLSFPPAKRPASYLTQCTANNLTIAYVALNSCVYRVPNSVYEFTYTPPVGGTVYATPCATVIPGGGLRYLYIAAGTSCPAYTFGNLEH